MNEIEEKIIKSIKQDQETRAQHTAYSLEIMVITVLASIFAMWIYTTAYKYGKHPGAGVPIYIFIWPFAQCLFGFAAKQKKWYLSSGKVHHNIATCIFYIITVIACLTPTVILTSMFRFDIEARTWDYNWVKGYLIIAPVVLALSVGYALFTSTTPPYSNSDHMTVNDWREYKRTLDLAGVDVNKVPLLSSSEIKSMSVDDWRTLARTTDLAGINIRRK